MKIACATHRWSPMQPGIGERFDGYGVCLECGRHEADVLPVRTVCVRCGATMKLYTAKLCEACYDACDDAELERIDGKASLDLRIRARELAHYRATTSPQQQAEDLAVGLAAIFDSFADKETP